MIFENRRRRDDHPTQPPRKGEIPLGLAILEPARPARTSFDLFPRAPREGVALRATLSAGPTPMADRLTVGTSYQGRLRRRCAMTAGAVTLDTTCQPLGRLSIGVGGGVDGLLSLLRSVARFRGLVGGGPGSGAFCRWTGFRGRVPGSGVFACGAGVFARCVGEFAGCAREFARGVGELACRAGEFAGCAPEFARCVGEFACGARGEVVVARLIAGCGERGGLCPRAGVPRSARLVAIYLVGYGCRVTHRVLLVAHRGSHDGRIAGCHCRRGGCGGRAR